MAAATCFPVFPLGLALAASPLYGQRQSKPWNLVTYTCQQHKDVGDSRPEIIPVFTFWVHGYLSGIQGGDVTSKPIDRNVIRALAKKMQDACEGDGAKLFLEAVKEVKSPFGEP